MKADMSPEDFLRWRDRAVSAVRLGQLRRPGAGRAVLAGVAAAYAWEASYTKPFSGKALLGVLLPGALLAVIAFGWPMKRVPAPEHIDILGFSYWLIAIACLFEWEASAFKDNSRPWHPALTTLLDPLLHPHPLKSLAMFLWLLTGWGLARR
jgi:predicted membrane-bound dolichyl-phosphate-mannose-protein mannosyltransferase